MANFKWFIFIVFGSKNAVIERAVEVVSDESGYGLNESGYEGNETEGQVSEF
nr:MULTISPECIES: hypothetical protein [unclassified Allomuricauda]|tara:strand:+ start:19948 stop:20103 length:156 start_codon:yes stop_codon:yes gene_type:complete